jgi:hypothetical protein
VRPARTREELWQELLAGLAGGRKEHDMTAQPAGDPPPRALCLDGPLRGKVVELPGFPLLSGEEMMVPAVPRNGVVVKADDRLRAYRVHRWRVGVDRAVLVATEHPRAPDPDDVWDLLVPAAAKRAGVRQSYDHARPAQ